MFRAFSVLCNSLLLLSVTISKRKPAAAERVGRVVIRFIIQVYLLACKGKSALTAIIRVLLII